MFAEYLICLNCIEIDSTQEILICAKYHGNKNLSILCPILQSLHLRTSPFNNEWHAIPSEVISTCPNSFGK